MKLFNPITLTQLKKLANQKGYAFTKVYKLPQDGGDKRVFFYTTVSELGGSTSIDITSGTRAKVVKVLFDIFSAAPDKEHV